MAQRILTSAIGLVVFFAVLFSNQIIFSVAISIVILLALYEIHMAMSSGTEISVISFISACLILVGIYFGNVQLSIILSMILYMTSSVFLHTKYSFKDVYSAAFITYFITFFFGTLIRLRADYGCASVFLVFIIAWGTDSAAYFTGKFLGKNKLIPKVSPKKTVEGAMGGVICAVVLSCIYFAVLKYLFHISNIGGAGYLGVIVLAFIASIFSQIGDLAASSIKRDCNVKDFGTILPGHGGVMDRFDSVVFIAPMVLYFFIYFNQWIL